MNRGCSGVFLSCNRLRIWCCHWSNLGCCSGLGLIPGLGTSACYRWGQKKDVQLCQMLFMYLLRWPYVFLFYFVKILNYIILFQMLNQPSIPGINLVIMYYFFTIVIQFAKMCLEFLHPLSWEISIYDFLCLQYSSQISVVVLFIYLFFFHFFWLPHMEFPGQGSNLWPSAPKMPPIPQHHSRNSSSQISLSSNVGHIEQVGKSCFLFNILEEFV